jgi:integrase
MAVRLLKYVKSYPDRHGKPRHYFRRKGYASVPLPPPGSSGFMAAYEAANALPAITPATDCVRVRFLPGSLGWAIERFMASEQYKLRAKNTRRQDQGLFDELRISFGAGKLRDLRDRHVKAIRNHFRDKFSTAIADAALGRVSALWQFADRYLDVDLGANPTVGVARIHEVKNEHEPWPDELFTAFKAQAPDYLWIAIMLLLYTGQLGCDVVTMRWSQLNGDTIEVVQQKTGEYVAIPCHKRLRSILSKLPRRGDFILTGKYGRPYKNAPSLSAQIRSQLRAMGIRRDYSMHGLRKNAAKALTEAGCPPQEVMAITGHRSAAMALHYSKRAEKKKLARAAIDKWEAADKAS